MVFFLGAGNDQKARAERGVGRVRPGGWGGGDWERATVRGRRGEGNLEGGTGRRAMGRGAMGRGQWGGRGKRWGGGCKGGERETVWGEIVRGDFAD